MLENIIKYLKKEKLNPSIEDNGVFFEYDYEDAKIPCGYLYDEEQNITRFYSEIAEFNKETRQEGILVCQLLNQDTVLLKFYISDENILTAEYYVFGNDMPVEAVEQVNVDLDTIYDTIEPYII